MKIEHIYIRQFAGIHDREWTFGPGINILEGPNESGKSTVCHFIKFMLYGVSDKEEKKLIFGWNGADKPVASGTMTVSVADGRYRIERSQSAAGKGSCKVVELGSNTTALEGKKPGEVWFGVDSEVFAHTAFVGQQSGSAVDGKTVGEGIENILFSADEDVNTQKALKKLDDARITLLYKHQNGGKIFEAQKRLEELELRFREAVVGNKSIIVKEGAVRDGKEKMAENDRRIAALEDGLDYHDTCMLKKRYDEWQGTNRRLEADRKALAELNDAHTVNGFVPDEGYAEDVQRKQAEVGQVLSEIGAVDGEIGRTARLLDGSESRRGAIGEADGETVALSEKRGKKSRLLIGIGVLCMVLAVVSSVAAVLLTQKLGSGVRSGGFLLGAALMIGGFALLIGGIRVKRKNEALFEGYGVKTVQELKRVFTEEGEKQRAAAITVAQLEALDEKKKALLARQESKEKELSDLLALWNKRSAEECLDDYRGYQSERKTLETQIELLGNSCRVIETEFRGKDAAELAGRFASLKERAASFGDPEKMSVDGMTRELNFLTMQQKVLRERCHEDEKTLAGLYATVVQPSAIHDKLEQVESALDRMKKRHAAYLLAYQALERAGGRMKENVAPRLSEYAGRMMGAVTDDKYSTLGVGKDLGLEFTADGMNQSAGFMSAGTGDVAYISLRLALIKLLYQKELPMPVFDESFSRLDDRRLGGMLTLLAKAADEEDMQVIVSTCQTREAKVMEQLGRYTYVRLA